MTESEPQNRCLGYARVSTYGQILDAQLTQLRAEGCTKIYQEKSGGVQADLCHTAAQALKMEMQRVQGRS